MSRKSRNDLVYDQNKELSLYKEKCERQLRRMGSLGKLSDHSIKQQRVMQSQSFYNNKNSSKMLNSLAYQDSRISLSKRDASLDF